MRFFVPIIVGRLQSGGTVGTVNLLLYGSCPLCSLPVTLYFAGCFNYILCHKNTLALSHAVPHMRTKHSWPCEYTSSFVWPWQSLPFSTSSTPALCKTLGRNIASLSLMQMYCLNQGLSPTLGNQHKVSNVPRRLTGWNMKPWELSSFLKSVENTVILTCTPQLSPWEVTTLAIPALFLQACPAWVSWKDTVKKHSVGSLSLSLHATHLLISNPSTMKKASRQPLTSSASFHDAPLKKTKECVSPAVIPKCYMAENRVFVTVQSGRWRPLQV